MKVIFLDIDGVICVDWKEHVDDYGHGFRPDYVDNLRAIIEATGAKIVISSSWRMMGGLRNMKEMWTKRNLPGEVIDITPELWTKRGEEIEEYLRENPANKFVILDDDTDFLPDQKPFFVRTSLNESHEDAFRGMGLTKKCAEKAIEILNK